jgi:TetR/AcrR family transcriptional regulator, transcriptional repressor for nem operon
MASKGILTKQNIIDKSTQIFSVKGYFNTSVADIAKETGLTKGGLYAHFRNKEEIWNAVYDECARTWKNIVFNGVRDISDPLERIERVIENTLRDYLGGDVFEGGCFMFNMLVELSGQSSALNEQVLQGFKRFIGLLHSWLEEADQKGMLKDGLNLYEVANYIVISLNGAGPLYSSSKDPSFWKYTLSQLHLHLNNLKKTT